MAAAIALNSNANPYGDRHLFQHLITYNTPRMITILGSVTIMVTRCELQDLITKVVFESKINYSKINYSKIYKMIIEKSGKKISHRDLGSALGELVDKNILQKTETYDKNNRVNHVFYSITESAIKENQHDLLGIDKKKQRLRMLFQLLFLYEISKVGQGRMSERTFDRFLKLVSLSKEDLKPVSTVEVLGGYGRFFDFEHIKGIQITKFEPGIKYKQIVEKTGAYSGITYNVTLPGFSFQEIMDYHIKTIGRRPIAYSGWYLNIFGYVKFTEKELEEAFRQFKKADIIKSTSLVSGDIDDPKIPDSYLRYTITDKRLRELIADVWKIYRDKHTLLFMKPFLGEELDEKEIQWLGYLFGEGTEKKMLKKWKDRSVEHQNYLKEKNKANYRNVIEIERIGTKAAFWRLSGDIKKHIQELNEKYKDVLEEYNFPLNLI